ncbi:GNAT family N-acetyltransferase [Anaerosolibacter sp.]|uniref:GNAT family N-acetyltransferase n=1 Tax=Anaerosolibacter sp. TaxID=1872527 RepID=UPI0039F108C8
MIREILEEEYGEVLQFIEQDIGRNYFIRLGLENTKRVYERIIGEWDHEGKLKAVLFRRKLGNLQFYAWEHFDVEGFAESMGKMEFKALIGPASYCDSFLGKNLFSAVHGGAIIAKLAVDNHRLRTTVFDEIDVLRVQDLDEVVAIYEKVFTGFSGKPVMEERLNSGRGRGLCIRRNGKIAAVAQSEFEMNHAALIVGVATDPEFQRKGLGTKCVEALCGQLLREGKDLYLQYDNIDAGRIYESLGFIPFDQVMHYEK